MRPFGAKVSVSPFGPKVSKVSVSVACVQTLLLHNSKVCTQATVSDACLSKVLVCASFSICLSSISSLRHSHSLRSFGDQDNHDRIV